MPGKRRTYTSDVPDSSETYAIQRPSGDSRACASLNDVFKRGLACPPSSGNSHRSSFVAALCSA